MSILFQKEIFHFFLSHFFQFLSDLQLMQALEDSAIQEANCVCVCVCMCVCEISVDFFFFFFFGSGLCFNPKESNLPILRYLTLALIHMTYTLCVIDSMLCVHVSVNIIACSPFYSCVVELPLPPSHAVG